MNWDTRLFRSFLVLAEELHFGRTADRLTLSQPALSRQIKELERRVGTSLLTRGTRSVALTEPGELLRRELPGALGNLDRILDQARRIGRGEEGHLCIGFVGSAVETVLTNLLLQTRRSHPGLSFTLIERPWVEQTAGLDSGQDDLAFVRDLRDDPNWGQRPLHTEPICLVVRDDHPLATRSRITMTDLQTLSETPFLSNAEWIARHCRDWPFRPRVVDDVTSSHGVLELVRADQGVSFMPASYTSWARAGLRFVPVAGHTTTQQVAWDRRRQSSARRIVLAQLSADPAKAPTAP